MLYLTYILCALPVIVRALVPACVCVCMCVDVCVGVRVRVRVRVRACVRASAPTHVRPQTIFVSNCSESDTAQDVISIFEKYGKVCMRWPAGRSGALLQQWCSFAAVSSGALLHTHARAPTHTHTHTHTSVRARVLSSSHTQSCCFAHVGSVTHILGSATHI